jgi:NAD(P)-dependent dehydrogenase (short-subunit alcohol dehydrogenase family)
MQLKGKVAVITGGDSRIGLASARLFFEEGANVVVMSNNADMLRAARGQLGAKVMTIEAVVTDANALGDSFAEVVIDGGASQAPQGAPAYHP